MNNDLRDDDLVFQIIDWDSFNDDTDDEISRYAIRLFGKTKCGQTVYLQVDNFTPSFYVEMDDIWSDSTIMQILRFIKTKVYPKENVQGLIKTQIVKKHKFWGFTNHKQFKFLQLTFNNMQAFKSFEYAFARKISIPWLRRTIKFRLYESNINPMIRFEHMRQLDAVGWVKVARKNLKSFPKYIGDPTIAKINYSCDWQHVDPLSIPDIQELTILAFDIECTSVDGSFPLPEILGNRVIQIGMTLSRFGQNACYRKILLSLLETADIPDVEVMWFDTEEKLLLEFTKQIMQLDPDIITGYNIFGFDFEYLMKRAKKLNIYTKFSRLSRVRGEISEWIESKLASSALGDNFLKYYKMTGRVIVDLMKVIQREYKLQSYKLDNVASHFIRESIKNVELREFTTRINTKSTDGIRVGDYVTIYYFDGMIDNKFGDKYCVTDLGTDYLIVRGTVDIREELDQNYKAYWCQAKDDIHPSDIFKFFQGTPEERAIIGKYCIQDCALCNRLINMLQILVNNIGMANVCHVPLSYLFLRGQGVKIFSLVSKKCREMNHLIPVIKKKNKEDKDKKFQKFVKQLDRKDDDESDSDEEDDVGYEGARVFVPEKGVYYVPVPVLDFNSLYPNAMILRNLSHESIVLDNQYMNLPGYQYHRIDYLNDDGTTTTCYFAEKTGVKAILPQILSDLLSARKIYKNKAEDAIGFMKTIYDGLQLAYKITANSLYGQTGAPTSPIYMKEIAASTTATGREMLEYSKEYIEVMYANIIRFALSDRKRYMDYIRTLYQNVQDEKFAKVYNQNVDKGEFAKGKFGDVKWTNREEFFNTVYKIVNQILVNKTVNPKVIYGDTDSVFFCMNVMDQDHMILKDDKALDLSIQLGLLASITFCILLPSPMNMEYEKTLWPFLILTKKRYVGNLYQTDPKKYYQKSMGIVLKRRDNAPIVKVVCGGIIDQILNKHNPEGAVQFTRKTLYDIITEKFEMDRFILTKTLKADYKDRNTIVHAVLADRIGIREPGNKPQPSDRIAYAYVEINKKVKLQGERVETPEYIQKNSLRLDYLFYITNQIMKPAVQFLDLIALKPEKIFKDYIIREQNRRKCMKPIMSFFAKKYHNPDSDQNSNSDSDQDSDQDRFDKLMADDSTDSDVNLVDLNNITILTNATKKTKTRKTMTRKKKPKYEMDQTCFDFFRNTPLNGQECFGTGTDVINLMSVNAQKPKPKPKLKKQNKPVPKPAAKNANNVKASKNINMFLNHNDSD